MTGRTPMLQCRYEVTAAFCVDVGKYEIQIVCMKLKNASRAPLTANLTDLRLEKMFYVACGFIRGRLSSSLVSSSIRPISSSLFQVLHGRSDGTSAVYRIGTSSSHTERRRLTASVPPWFAHMLPKRCSDRQATELPRTRRRNEIRPAALILTCFVLRQNG